MANRYTLLASAAVPDAYTMFTDQTEYAAYVGTQLQGIRTAGGRIMWLAHTEIKEDTGWSKEEFNVVYADATGDGYSPIAPSVLVPPELHGGNEVGHIISAINGRADAWPPPRWWRTWALDGVEIKDPSDPSQPWARDYYIPTAADIGKELTSTQHWENVAGVDSATSAPVTIVDASIPVPTGTVRYIGQASAGTGDGTSWANRMAASQINRAIREVMAGGGDTILVGADLGPYTVNSFAIQTGPSDPANRIHIRPVNSVTGKRQALEISSSRSALNPAAHGMTQPSSQGSSGWRIGPLWTSYTVNLTTDVLTVSQEFYDQCATGDAVRASKASGTTTYSPEITSTTPVPGGATNTTMMQVYYVIKTGVGREIKLAATAADAAAGTSINVVTAPVGTQYLTYCGETSDVLSVDLVNNLLEVTPEFYARLRNSAVVAVRTTGTLPTGLDVAGNSFCYWTVRKQGSNKISLHTSGRLAHLDGTRVVLGTAGTGTLSVWLNMPTKCARNLTIHDVNFTDVGNGGIVLQQSEGVTINNCHVVNCYRGLECLDWTSSVGQRDCGTWDLTIQNFHVYGAERGLFRLRYGHLDTNVIDSSCDGRYIDGDAFPSLFCLEGEAVGPTDQGPIRTTYTRCQGKRARRTYSSSEYWNADIFEDNTPSAGITYTDCEASWAADGGFDCKSSGSTWNNCIAAFCKRNYRLWGTGMTFNDCVSWQPQRASEPWGENGGSLHVGLFEGDVISTWNNCKFRDIGTTPIIEMASSTNTPVITLNNIDVIRRPNTNQFHNDYGATMSFSPAYYTGAPSASAAPYTSSSTSTASVTVTTNQPGGTVEIRPGGDGALFQVDGMVVSSTAPLDPTSPTDSDSDGVYQVNLRYYNSNSGNPDFVDFTWTATMINLANFPSVVASSTAVNDTNSTTHNITLPSGITAGQEIHLIFGCDGTATITSPAGFTNLTDNSGIPGTHRTRACYKVATGSEGGTTVSFTTSASEMSVIQCLVLASRDAAQAPQLQRAENATATTSPNPATITFSWGAANTTAFTYIVWDNGTIGLNSGAINGGYPTGWTPIGSIANNSSAGVGLAIAYLNVTGTSVDPTSWSLSSAAAVYRNTLAVKGV